MIHEVRDIANERRALFRDYPYDMIAAYNRDLETSEGYNGRQLLELIQNCDDEGATKVQVSLDKDKRILSIANTGNTFSKKGYRSIVTSNLSPKKDRERYIGDKGLGFRSIIYWAEEIQIQSNNVLLTFNDFIRETEFEALFTAEKRKEIKEENGLGKEVVPLPVLAIPKVQKFKSSSDFSTTIKINYEEEFLPDILKQVQKLRPEILLFLHNINEINFVGFDGKEDLKCEKERIDNEGFGPSEIVQVNDKSWQVFTKEGKVSETVDNGDELEYYQLKLAINESMENNFPYLFSFFPTEIKLDFPYFIHGTFDLGQNRNSLNNTSKNQKVLQVLVDFIIETAKYYSGKEVDWRPFELLHFDKHHKNERLNELGFYRLLKNAIHEQEIWPCVIGKYKKRKNVIHIEDDFSKFILENGFSGNFANLIIPKTDSAIGKYFNEPNIRKIEDAIDKIAKKIDEVKVRADLIYFSNKYFNDKKFSFITDREGEVVDKNNDVFTPSSRAIDLPAYCKVHFINDELYEQLIKKFELQNVAHKARELQRILKSNCNIYSFEPQYLVQKLISQANKVVSGEGDLQYKRQVVNEMTQSLFGMYQDMAEPSPINIENIPLINIEGDIVYSKNLFFNDAFEIGRKANEIFKNVRDNSQILAYPSEYELQEESTEALKDFFTWLKVNIFTRVEAVTEKSNLQGDEFGYKNFVFKKKLTQSNKFESLSYTKIHDIDSIISHLSIEELLCWFILDTKIQDQFITDKKNGKLAYKHYNTKYVRSPPSYLHYKLKQHGYNFEQYLVESKYKWVNENKIDFNHKLFKELDLHTFEIENILKSLGGKASISELSMNKLTNIINDLPNVFPDGKRSQTTYKDALEHFEKNDEKPSEPLKLFAKVGKNLKVLPQEDIYFSDKVKLPASIQDQFPTLNFPMRSGAKKAIEFFGINDLEDVKIKVKSFELNESLNKSFNEYLNELKPYLFLYRLNQIESEEQKNREANYIKELNIEVCSSVFFEVGGEKQSVHNYEYVSGSDRTYYIKCDINNTLEDLRRSSDFSDSFSSILADLFDVSRDKHEYRAIFRNGLEDAKHVAAEGFAPELVNESMIRLGVGDNYSTFWSAVYKCLGDKYTDQNVTTDLDVQTDIRSLNYENLNTNENLNLLSYLFEDLDISISAFNSHSPVKIDLVDHHTSKLKSEIFNLFKPFEKKSWERLSECEVVERTGLLQTWFDFENCDDEIENFAYKNREVFEPNHESFLSNYVAKSDFDIVNLRNHHFNGTDLDNLYKTNLNEFNGAEKEFILENQALRSLLYFNDTLDYLRNEVESEFSVDNNEQAQGFESPEENTRNGDNTETKTVRGKKLSTRKKSTKSRKKQPYQPPRNGSENKKVGNKCEELARQELIKNYGEQYVNLVTKRDEGKHYDIRYSPDEGKTWKYVEVKNYAKGRFILSKEERDFGKSNSQHYEFHLVNLANNEIYPIEDPYENSSLEFKDKDYVVYYKLEDENL